MALNPSTLDHPLTDESVAGIGDNAPPDTLITGVALNQHLDLTYAENVSRAEELLAKGTRFLTITDDTDDSEATEYMVKLRACWKTAEAARASEKTPYDDAAGVVHAFFKTKILDPLGAGAPDKRPFDPLTRTDIGMGPRILMAQTIYKSAKVEAERKRREEEARAAREEEDRRRREAAAAEAAARELERSAARKRNEESRVAAEAAAAEARRKADEARQAENRAAEERSAAERQATAPAAEMSRARGERGGISSLRQYLEVRDISRADLDLEMLRPYFTDKALEQAVNAFKDANKATVENGIRNDKQPLRGAIFYHAQRAAGRA